MIFVASLQSFPDELIIGFQLAALCPKFSAVQRNGLIQNTEEWSRRLSAIIKRGLISTRHLNDADRRLWKSFRKWNGFSHVCSLLSSGVADFLSDFLRHPFSAEVSSTEAMRCFLQYGESERFLDDSFLKTICVMCNALLHFGSTDHGRILAEIAAVGYLLAVGSDLRIDATAAKCNQNVLDAMRKLCDLKTVNLWPPDKDVLTPLLLLWRIITKLDSELWDDRSLRLSKDDTTFSWIVAFSLKCLSDRPEKEFIEEDEIEDANEVSVNLHM